MPNGPLVGPSNVRNELSKRAAFVHPDVASQVSIKTLPKTLSRLSYSFLLPARSKQPPCPKPFRHLYI